MGLGLTLSASILETIEATALTFGLRSAESCIGVEQLVSREAGSELHGPSTTISHS